MPEINEQYIFNYNWFDVSRAYWLKYPNPYNKTIESIDILDRKILPNGNLYTKRIITTNTYVPIPKFIRKYFNIDNFYILEESIIDRNNKKFVINTRNICYLNLIKSNESVEYSSINCNNNYNDNNSYNSDNNDNQTLMTQQINISINGYSYLENKAVSIIKNNIQDGRLGMNYILSQITTKKNN